MIAENVKNIRESIAATCYRIGRDPQTVDLIAVSKTFGAEDISVANDAGVKDFGENYVQELVGKRDQLSGRDIHWHFIGHLQTNKVKYIVDWMSLIQSVDSDGLAAEIEKRGSSAGKIVDLLIEVNTSEEATKFGVRPALAMDLIRAINNRPSLRLKGLMTIGPFSDVAEESRASFRTLKNIFDHANAAGFLRTPMTILSMGMTHDYPIAIEEGSTMVRVGTAIFGTRKKRD